MLAAEPALGAVAGAIANGTPDDRIGTAGYLLEFSEWLPGRIGRPAHAASCNLLVRRSDYDLSDGMPKNLWPGEDTVYTVPFARAGRLGWADGAVVRHLNRTDRAVFLAHQRLLGASFAGVCREVDFPYGWVTRRPFLPLAFPLRLLALTKRIWLRPGAGGRPDVPVWWVLRGLLEWWRGLSRAASESTRTGTS